MNTSNNVSVESMMNEEALLPFKGKYCKLVHTNDFVIDGTIEDVYSDSLLFKTYQQTSLISFSAIKEVIIIE